MNPIGRGICICNPFGVLERRSVSFFLIPKIPTDGDYMRRHTKIMVYDLRDRRLITLPTQESGSHYVWNNRNQLIASCIIMVTVVMYCMT